MVFEQQLKAPPDCALCPRLVASRKMVVNGFGPLPADTLIIAQNPGRVEEVKGRPLYEKAYSGEKLREELLPRAGLDSKEVRYENIVRCRPPKKRVGGDFPPTPEEVRNCAPFLFETIRRCRPRCIITLGALAYKWFFPKGKLDQDHGRSFQVKFSELEMLWNGSGIKSKKEKIVGNGKEPDVISGTDYLSLKTVSNKPIELLGCSPTVLYPKDCSCSTNVTTSCACGPKQDISILEQSGTMRKTSAGQEHTTTNKKHTVHQDMNTTKRIHKSKRLDVAVDCVLGEEVKYGEITTNYYQNDPNDSIFEDFTFMVVPMFHPAFGAPGRNVSIVPTMLDDWSHLKEILEASNDLDHGSLDEMVEYSEATGAEVAEYLEGASEFAFDFEFDSHMWPIGVEGVKPTFQARRARPIGYSVSVREGHALYTTDSIEHIRVFLEDPMVRTIAHNAKCEYVVAAEQGIFIKNLHCTKVQAYLLRKSSTGLKDLSWTELGVRQTRIENVDWTNPESYVPYGCADSDLTLRHDHNFMPELLERGSLMSLYKEIEQPIISVIGNIERRGVMLDRRPFERLAEKLTKRIEELEIQLDEVFGSSINYNSGAQLGDALYGPLNWRVRAVRVLVGRDMHDSTCSRKGCVEKACAAGIRTGAQSVLRYIPPGLGLPIKVTTDTLQPATDMDTLRLYDHPVVDRLVERASAAKVLSRDCRLPDLMQEDGRVHASFHQAGGWEEQAGDSKEAPVTGRLSSSGPNLQNIVHHGDTGRPYVAEWAAELRRGFIAPPGYTLMKVDVGQEEPRIGAVLAGDEGLIRELTEGDVYRLVAGWEFKKPAEEIDKEERQIGKRGFMAWLNGAGASGIKTSAYWLSTREGWEVIFELRKLYPKVEIWRKEQEMFLKENGYTTTYFGREILRPEIWGGDNAQRRHALRSVAPDPIQGTAADILKIGMARVANELPKGAGIILPVHDELVVETPMDVVSEVASVLGTMVEGLLPIHFPLDVMIGPNWYDMEDFQHD